MEDPDDVAAHHEAGHAVVSLRLRDYVGDLEFLDGDEHHAARAQTWTLAPPLVNNRGGVARKASYSRSEEEQYSDAAKISLAGPAAEGRYADRTLADALTRNQDDRKKARHIVHSVWGGCADAVFARLETEIQELVDAHWDSIQRVAEELQTKRKLSGDDVRRISAETG